jgi:hypothetical protein
MYNLESVIAKIESQVTGDDERLALVTALKARLTELRQAESELAGESTLTTPTTLTKEKSAEPAERGERPLQPEAFPTERQVSADRARSLSTEQFAPPSDPDEPNDNAKNFAAALDKLDPALRQVAADLYEELHYKSKFARLTSAEREAIVQLLRIHSCERVVEIIAQPRPLGMNLKTSRQGVGRFREDYIQAAIQEQKRRAAEADEERRLALEESFKKANASDDDFRKATEIQIRKRLFQVAHDPSSDFHEIRWLIRSLEMLNFNHSSSP